jgi:hypothetical protein
LCWNYYSFSSLTSMPINSLTDWELKKIICNSDVDRCIRQKREGAFVLEMLGPMKTHRVWQLTSSIYTCV